MNTTRFQIDLTEKFETLKNSPIVEAVIQFNAPPSEPFEENKLQKLLARQFSDYALQGQMQVEAGFEHSVAGSVSMHHNSQWDGFRLQSKDGKYVCQWKRKCLVFSRLRPYESWPKLLDAAMPFWNAYHDVGRPDIIEGIGVRYISQISLQEGEKPSKYVQRIHPPLKGLGLKADSCRLDRGQMARATRSSLVVPT